MFLEFYSDTIIEKVCFSSFYLHGEGWKEGVGALGRPRIEGIHGNHYQFANHLRTMSVSSICSKRSQNILKITKCKEMKKLKM